MSLWEINQIVYRQLLDKCYWHVSNSMLIDKAYEALGKKVSLRRISDEIQIKDNDISFCEGFAGTASYRKVR